MKYKVRVGVMHVSVCVVGMSVKACRCMRVSVRGVENVQERENREAYGRIFGDKFLEKMLAARLDSFFSILGDECNVLAESRQHLDAVVRCVGLHDISVLRNVRQHGLLQVHVLLSFLSCCDR